VWKEWICNVDNLDAVNAGDTISSDERIDVMTLRRDLLHDTSQRNTSFTAEMRWIGTIDHRKIEPKPDIRIAALYRDCGSRSAEVTREAK
jgi:hypothetical protein